MSNGQSLKDRSRQIARNRFWEEHDKSTYNCPGCSRGPSSLPNGFEVHHINGDAFDNRMENLIGVCRACHMIREGKKPALYHIIQLQKRVEYLEQRLDRGSSVDSNGGELWKGASEIDQRVEDHLTTVTIQEDGISAGADDESEWDEDIWSDENW